MSKASVMVAAALMLALAGAAQANVDVKSAQALAKKSNCTKCHTPDRKKDGPSYKETAEKYKGKADAENILVKHLTTNPKIKVDGVEETHENVKSKDDKEIRNLVKWILSH